MVKAIRLPSGEKSGNDESTRAVTRRWSLPSAFMMKMPGRPVRSDVKANTPPPLPLSGPGGVEVGVAVAGGGFDGVAEGSAVGVVLVSLAIAVGAGLAGPAQPQASAVQSIATSPPGRLVIMVWR